MPWLPPSIIATAAGTALLAFVFCYLYYLDRKKYLAVWAVSWSVYFVRFIFEYVKISAPQNDIILIGSQLSSLFSGIILLWGTYQFIDRKFPRFWLVWSALGTLWILVSTIFKFEFFLMSIPTFTFLALVYIGTGITFGKSEVARGAARTTTGAAFIVWGLHKINYPFLRPVVWFAPWGFLLAAVLEFVVALGMLLVYFQRVREDLKHEQFFLQKAQEMGQVGSWELDIAKNKLFWTEENYKIFGITPGTVLTYETFLECVHPDDREFVDRKWSAAFDHEPYDIRHRLIVDDEVKWVREKAELEFDLQGNCVRGIGFTQDITELKQAEEEQEKLQAQLTQAQKMESVGQLAGGVAHDFNNMLSVILGHAEMALTQVRSDNPVYDHLVEIDKATHHSADLTRQLLAFARKQPVLPKVLDLNQAVAGLISMLKRLIGENIDLSWKPGKAIWSVKVDPSQLGQILANLCINSRDAITEAGKILITTENISFDEDAGKHNNGLVPGEYVRLAVIDNGCGIGSDALPRLFEPFFTTKEVGKGTGLGLASVYGAVKQNKGYISVDSEPGKGTSFKIYLPRNRTEREDKDLFTESSAGERRNGTILLVEDEPAILMMTETMLRGLGFCVLSAGTPEKALDTAMNYDDGIDLIMTDVIMPGMNGRELAAKVMDFYPEVKALYMSGYNADIISDQGVLEEQVHFLQKPFTMKLLSEKLQEVLQ
jgi:two-component system, cell cycle sensor histidine kinase and response regulator CckA